MSSQQTPNLMLNKAYSTREKWKVNADKENVISKIEFFTRIYTRWIEFSFVNVSKMEPITILRLCISFSVKDFYSSPEKKEKRFTYVYNVWSRENIKNFQ